MKLKLVVSDSRKSETVSPDDMGFTQEEWDGMLEEARFEELRKYVDDLPDQPFWDIESLEW